jgi:hydrogenase expression/formation protein HypD
MKYMSAFRDSKAASAFSLQIRKLSQERPIRIMEVCGGHTMTIYKYGIKDLLPESIHLVSGPGCPVCVTSNGFIDHAVALACLPGVIVASFGDLIRVPGSSSSLLTERSQGRDVRVCYSPMDAVEIAGREPDKQVVFLGIGFETTAPTVAAAVKHAKTAGIKNFKILSAHKTMPHALRALVENRKVNIDALICPGHVSAIAGTKIYDFLADQYHIPCVVCGFEPMDMLQSIFMIIQQLHDGRAEVENQYSRVVTMTGNSVAQQLLKEVFMPCDMEWRGLGLIPESGLTLNNEYQDYDAVKTISVHMDSPSHENPACVCGDIMLGLKTPADCPLFGKACIPETPKGACMVSSEGNCAIYFKFFDKR